MTERYVASFEVVPGTDINEIRKEHPDWTEEQCRAEQSRVATVAFKKLFEARP